MKTTFAAATFIMTFAVGALAQGSQMPKPGPEHQRLHYYVGEWKSEGAMKPSAYGPGGTSTVINHNRMLGDFFLVLESEGTGPMGPVKEVAVIGYDSNRKTYTFDQFSTRGEHGTATATVSGDMWTWLIPEVDMGGKKVKGRFTIKEVSPTEYTYKYDTSVDGGAWTNALEGKATKTK